MSKEGKSGLATASLVLGIIAAVLAFVPIINNAAFVLAILAFIFGLVPLFQKRSIGLAIAGIVLAIAAGVITVLIQQASVKIIDEAVNEVNTTIDDASGSNTDEILGRDIEVVIGEFTVETDEFGLSSTKLPVRVTNKLEEQASYSIQIEATSADGERIEEETVFVNNLNAGQTQTIDSFNLVTSDKYDTLKTAEFKVISVSKT